MNSKQKESLFAMLEHHLTAREQEPLVYRSVATKKDGPDIIEYTVVYLPKGIVFGEYIASQPVSWRQKYGF